MAKPPQPGTLNPLALRGVDLAGIIARTSIAISQRWAEFVHSEGCDWKKLTPAKSGGKKDAR